MCTAYTCTFTYISLQHLCFIWQCGQLKSNSLLPLIITCLWYYQSHIHILQRGNSASSIPHKNIRGGEGDVGHVSSVSRCFANRGGCRVLTHVGMQGMHMHFVNVCMSGVGQEGLAGDSSLIITLMLLSQRPLKLLPLHQVSVWLPGNRGSGVPERRCLFPTNDLPGRGMMGRGEDECGEDTNW